MKKLILLAIVLFYTSNLVTFAGEYRLTINDKKVINNISDKINNLISKNNLTFRISLEKKINEIQSNYNKNTKMYNIIENVKYNTYLLNYKNEYLNHYNENNIDYKKVKDKWINRHNYERNLLGRQLYSYDDRLNNTSYEWSKQQDSKQIMSHKRFQNSSYYDYNQVEKWFNDRGVRCEIKGGTTSSESIGKFGYYCNSNDCTDKLLESLKVIFDIYMNEKGMGYPADAHYRGIINQNISKIGLGIYIRKNKKNNYYEYYVTTHYCTKFKN